MSSSGTAESSEALPEDPFELNPTQGTIVGLWGRKGSGKSHAARRLWRTWPRDKVGIDVNGDLEPGDGAERLHDVPSRFPVELDLDGPRYRSLYYRADVGSPTHRDDMDRVIGLSLYPSDRPCLLWLDEVGEVSQVHRTRPNLRRLLMQSRHHGPASALLCGPRPANVDPLCYLQADQMYIFDLPNEDDRAKLAKMMRLSVREFDEHDQANRREHGEYAFLFWHAPSQSLYPCPPLPYP